MIEEEYLTRLNVQTCIFTTVGILFPGDYPITQVKFKTINNAEELIFNIRQELRRIYYKV